VRIIGSTLRSRAPEVKAKILSDIVEKVYPLIDANGLKPTVCAVFPITEVEAAQDMLYRSENVGKVVMTVKA
jgi:NADPH2:quinone reductase